VKWNGAAGAVGATVEIRQSLYSFYLIRDGKVCSGESMSGVWDFAGPSLRCESSGEGVGAMI